MYTQIFTYKLIHMHRWEARNVAFLLNCEIIGSLPAEQMYSYGSRVRVCVVKGGKDMLVKAAGDFFYFFW